MATDSIIFQLIFLILIILNAAMFAQELHPLVGLAAIVIGIAMLWAVNADNTGG